ncbi:hypothetical protein EIP91_008982 [Steccherinum ochraceum]|uniref:F-box domain-containing protein n=1 Tax=Steccherinum ochraceum TaxID=92696 RepID=A0A4R0S053_9APHY|nr:hypothetical protein EIP91_008982 [Steccherinum ochraceum]
MCSLTTDSSHYACFSCAMAQAEAPVALYEPQITADEGRILTEVLPQLVHAIKYPTACPRGALDPPAMAAILPAVVQAIEASSAEFAIEFGVNIVREHLLEVEKARVDICMLMNGLNPKRSTEVAEYFDGLRSQLDRLDAENARLVESLLLAWVEWRLGRLDSTAGTVAPPEHESPDFTPDTRKRSRVEVDARIARWRHGIDDATADTPLRLTQHNSHLALSNMPTEILQEIFCLTTDKDAGSRRNFTLGLVCRHWKDLALGCSKLWSYIVANKDTNMDVVRTLIERSTTVPLHVCLEHTSSRDRRLQGQQTPPVIQLILTELPRIRTLYLSVPHATYREVKDLFNVPARELKSLAISLEDSEVLQPTALREPFPATAIHTPALTTLEITHFGAAFSFALAHHSCSSIKHLRIHIAHNMPKNPSMADTLLSTLQSMPHLTVLDIDTSFLPVTLPSYNRNFATLCRSLTCLRLEGRISHLNWLLAHMQLSPTIHIDLTIGDLEPTNAHCAELGDRLHKILFPAHHAAANSPAPLDYAGCFFTDSELPVLHIMLSDTLEVVQDQFAEFAGSAEKTNCISAYESSEPVEADFRSVRGRVLPAPHQPGGRTVHLKMHATDPWVSQPSRETLWKSFPLQDVKTVFLSHIIEGPHRRLCSTFLSFVTPMAALQNLIVHGWRPWQVQELLVPHPPTHEEGDWATPLPFPNLQSFTLIKSPSQTPPNDKALWPKGESEPKQRDLIFEPLYTLFQYRQQTASTKIRDLFLYNYDILDWKFVHRGFEKLFESRDIAIVVDVLPTHGINL